MERFDEDSGGPLDTLWTAETGSAELQPAPAACLADPPEVRISCLVVPGVGRSPAGTIAGIARQTREASFELLVIAGRDEPGLRRETLARLPVREVRPAEDANPVAALNEAAALAHGEFILLIDAEARLVDRALDRLAAFADLNPEAMIWGGRVEGEDGLPSREACGGRITPWSSACRALGLSALMPDSPLFNSEVCAGWQHDSVREVDVLGPAFLLIRRDLWCRLGGLDQDLSLSAAAADLCLRARRLAAQPLFTPDARITVPPRRDVQGPARLARVLGDRARLVRRHWPRLLVPVGLALLLLWPASRVLALSTAGLLTRRIDRRLGAHAWAEALSGAGTWLRDRQRAPLTR
ncbi:MAG: glycosyltransferase [Hyphomicrobiaceae bacterium]